MQLDSHALTIMIRFVKNIKKIPIKKIIKKYFL